MYKNTFLSYHILIVRQEDYHLALEHGGVSLTLMVMASQMNYVISKIIQKYKDMM